MGVATNLDVFDEKYLLAGCRFLVYLCTTLPILLFFLALIALLLALPFRLMPRSIREKISNPVAGWLAKPYCAAILGCAAALLMIQLLLRQCLLLNNLLLAGCLLPGWISSLFMAGEGALTLYFSGLLAGIGLTGALLLYSLRPPTATSVRWVNALLAMLFAIECLLLPVNYGMLIASRWLPRVEDVRLANNSPEDGTAWLVFENKEVLIYLVRGKNDARKLITVPRKDSHNCCRKRSGISDHLCGPPLLPVKQEPIHACSTSTAPMHCFRRRDSVVHRRHSAIAEGRRAASVEKNKQFLGRSLALLRGLRNHQHPQGGR